MSKVGCCTENNRSIFKDFFVVSNFRSIKRDENFVY